MHVLFLTDNFPPEVNAPASRTFEHCRLWVQDGHRMTVVTCAPNFPRGRVFEGYKNRLWQRETVEGIEVIRVWTYITANEGFWRRVLDYLSFMVSSILASLFVRKVDVVVGTSPQFFTACAAYVVGVLKRIPFVFELRDLWPESIKAVGAMPDSPVLRLLERVELFLYKHAARIVSVTHSFKAALIARGIEADKIDVVTNGVDLSRYSPRPKDRVLEESLGLGGAFVAGYVGTHGMAHGLDTLLDAAQRLRAIPGAERLRILLLGDGAEKNRLRQRAQQMGLSNVLFIDTVAKEQVPRYWSLLDVSIIHLRRNPLFVTVIPSKLFECMGMGIPLVHGVAGESADIVKREGVGLVFEPDNADTLVSALLELMRDDDKRRQLKERCLSAARNYDRASLGRAMLASVARAATVSSEAGAAR